MLKRYSHSIAWVILSVWVFYTFIHTATAIFQLKLHHTTVNHILKRKKEKKLVQLTVPAWDNTFIRINKKEFIWQGEWYDILNISEKQGTLFITAYHDKKEKKLRNILSQAVEHEQENSGKNKINPKFELKEICITKVFFMFDVSCIKLIYKNIQDKIENIALSLPYPPPEII